MVLQTEKDYFSPYMKGIKKNLFELHDLSVCFGSNKALDKISLRVECGEMLVINGPSGAGKTTLLNLIYGNINPSSGSLIRHDLRLNGKKYAPFINFVFQDLKLIKNWTVEENLWFSWDSKSYSTKEQFYEEMVDLTKLVGIYDFLGKNIKDVNGGNRQKVAILRSLLSRPDVILADEVTSSLDKKNAFSIYEIFSFLNSKKKITVIWASHNKELFESFYGRIIFLESGRIINFREKCFI